MIEAALKTLRLPEEAGPDELRRAYVRLVRRYPPEHFPQKFSEIQSAFLLLSLDNSALGNAFEHVLGASSVLEAAAFFRTEPGPEQGDPLCGLPEILASRRDKAALHDILNNIDISAIKWRGGEND